MKTIQILLLLILVGCADVSEPLLYQLSSLTYNESIRVAQDISGYSALKDVVVYTIDFEDLDIYCPKNHLACVVDGDIYIYNNYIYGFDSEILKCRLFSHFFIHSVLWQNSQPVDTPEHTAFNYNDVYKDQYCGL